MKVNIDFGKIKQTAEQKVKEAMEICLDITKKDLEDRTPEDTKKLVSSYKKLPIQKVGNKIIGKIQNKTPYGIYVEYGVQGKVYNYHKPKGKIFYRGVGARMLTRTKDYNMEKYKKLFLIKIGKGSK